MYAWDVIVCLFFCLFICLFVCLSVCLRLPFFLSAVGVRGGPRRKWKKWREIRRNTNESTSWSLRGRGGSLNLLRVSTSQLYVCLNLLCVSTCCVSLLDVCFNLMCVSTLCVFQLVVCYNLLCVVICFVSQLTVCVTNWCVSQLTGVSQLAACMVDMIFK